MNLISMEKIALTLRDKPLFQDVTLGIDEGEKIGFLGRNGSGKTTLLRLLAGDLEPDSGTISRNRNLRIELLDQNPDYPPGCGLGGFLFESTSETVSLLKEYRACFDEYEHNHKGGAKLAKLSGKMDAMECWDTEKTYSSLLYELGLRDPSVPMESLSGGMVKKAALARALAVRPSLLLLDEPTNHLDISTIEWLEGYLVSARLTFVMVTHDRYFLDAACGSIMELDGGRIYKYPGNYSTFLERREERLSVERNEQSRIASILRRELEWLKRGPKARSTKDKGRKQRIQDLMDRRIKEERAPSEFSSSHRRLGKKILEVRGIRKAYDGKDVIGLFSYIFRNGERIGLVGPNGSGKTTFLDLITGQLAPDEGTVDKGINTRFGYYDQMNRPLQESTTVLDFIEKKAETVTLSDGATVSAAKFLDLFGFPPAFHRMPVSRLSGGEKRRLYLIRVLSENPNFLVMDEPTNDLDIETLRRLEDYILSFPGCVLIVSHDRAFLDRSTDFLFLFDGSGAIQGFPGSYSEYHDETMEEAASGPLAGPPATQKPDRTAAKPREKAKLGFKEKREYEGLFGEIEKLETEKSELEASFSDPTLTPGALQEKSLRYSLVGKLIEEKTRRWEELASLSD
jgi:ATP-binding cassette subfamily F protein uup